MNIQNHTLRYTFRVSKKSVVTSNFTALVKYPRGSGGGFAKTPLEATQPAPKRFPVVYVPLEIFHVKCIKKKYDSGPVSHVG